MIRSLIASAATLSLLASPALAVPTANPASSLSVASSVRAGSPAVKSSRLAAPGATIGLILAAVVIGLGVYIAVDDNDDQPDSN